MTKVAAERAVFRFLAIRNILKSSKDLTTLVTYVKTRRRKVGRKRLFSSYLKTNPVAKLQLGAGGNQLAGWLNTDQSRAGFYLDLTEPFPLPDNSFSYITCEHAIEHIHYTDALAMLGECIRVLKSGGKLRVSTPDLARYADMIVRPDEEPIRRSIDWYFHAWVMPGHGSAQFYKPLSSRPNPAFIVNDAFRNYGHQFIYDFDTLTEALANVGFREICRVAVGVSTDENLRGIDTRVAPEEAHLSLVVEATK